MSGVNKDAEYYANLANLLEATIDSKDQGQTFLGSFTSYANIEIEYFAGEMAFLFVIQIFFFHAMLGKMNGRFFSMKAWVHSLDFEIMGNVVKSDCAVTYMTIIGYSYVVMPFITLILWFVYMLKDAGNNEREYNHKNPVFMGAISILLLGIAVCLAILAVTKITWNNYRFKQSHLLIFLVAYLSFSSWQFCITFASTYEDFNFQGVSAVFLIQSFIIMTIIIYLNLYENKFNLIYFLNRFMSKDGEKQDPNRDNDILKEIESQKADEDWLPSIHDIYDIITIGQISEKKMMNAFGRGFQKLAMERSPMIKKVVNVVFLMIYLAILAAYSYIVYDHDHGSKLGLVSSIAVIINDLYVYLMYNARIINRISIISLIMFCSRVFICLGGSDYWVYGYLVIFVWLQCIIALGIVEKRLPYNSEMIAQPAENLLSAKKTQFVNLAHVPEFIFLIIVVGLVGSIVVATAVKPDGVYLKDLPVGEGVPYEAATALAILIVVSFLFVASWIRSFKRKIDRTAAQTYVYLCAYRVDVYYIFSLICYMCTCFWTLGIYAFADNKNILINGFLLPLIMFFFFNIVIIYMLNNYYFVEDINGINRSIVAHNKRVDALRVKAKTLKQRMNEEGPEAVYGEEHGRIVQKVMDIEVARRQAAKLTKQIDGNDADSSIKRSATGALGRQIVTNKPKAIQNQSAVQPDQLMDVEDSSVQLNGQVNSANPDQVLLDGGIKSNDVPPSPSKKAGFGDTMSGFKLEDDSSEEDLTNIPPYMIPYRQARIDKKRKMIQNYSDMGLSFMEAFFQGKLRSNDYVMLWSMIFLVATIIVYGALSTAYTYQYQGIVFTFIVLHIVLLAISMLGNIVANRTMDTWERYLQIIAFVIVYLAGIVFLVMTYDTGLLSKDNDDLNVEERAEKEEAQSFITAELIVIPFITAFVAFCAKAWRDNTNGRSMTTGFWILLILNFFHGIALVVVFFIYLPKVQAYIALFVLVFFFYDLVQYIIRVRYSTRGVKISEQVKITPYQIGGIFNFFNILLALVVLISAIVYTRESETIAYFATVSIISWIIIIFLGFGALARWVADRTRMDEMPIYHSPWIFPIYKYYPKDNDIEPYSSAVVAFYSVVGLAWLWCVLVTVEISPSYVGVALTCVLEGITVFVTLYFINTNNVQYKKIRPHVDQLCIKTAWLDAKENLVKMVQIESRSEYQSYETWWRRRHMLRNYMNFWRGNTVLAWPEQEEFEVQKREFENAQNQGAFLRDQVEKWADPDEVDLDCWEDCQKFMMETDKDLRGAYMAELETIIQFQLIILQNAKKLAAEERCYLLKFIKAKRAELFLVGINFELSNAESIEVRYAAAMANVKKLTPDKQTLFDALKQKYVEEKRQEQVKEQLAADEEERKAEERMEALAQMSNARRQAMERMLKNPDMPLDEMPDCVIKLQKLRQDCKDNTRKFTDTQFSHEDEVKVLGQNIIDAPGKRTINNWKRASDIPGAVLFRDGASHEDITQGALGDCYFLSALSVLGNSRTVELFVCQEDSDHKNESDPNHWKKTGAFMLKFSKNGEFEYVIVDDWLPMCNDTPAFTKGGMDGLEIWPAILEKAYAKLYGSYQAIEAGKVHLALADLVENGFPEQLALKTYKNNVKVFAEKMRFLDKVQALMGAGSPEHEMGDRAINEEGIVQGHAYAILDVADYMSEQLMMLRNPHGKADYTNEWTGDWADDSEKWTQKAKATLNYTPNEQVDGIFWMQNQDFLNNFKYVYICRELTEKAGWYNKAIDSSWYGPSSAGFPGKLRMVPQFKLTIHSPCQGYISLTQKDNSASSFKGENFIGWMVSREQGKIIGKLPNKSKLIMKAGISDLKVLSSAIEFDEKVDYPYTFTIVCGSRYAGQKGEGDFEIKVYSRDQKMKLEKLNHTE